MSGDPALSMDRMYRVQRHFYDATRKYYLLGRDRLIADLKAPPSARVLEIGCGTGRNLIALARRHPGARLFGLDASSVMLATAQGNLTRAGLTGRVRLAQGLAQQFDARAMFGLEGAFDAIVISYALSMIPPWRESIDRALDHLKPGGQLAIVDFYDQRDLPAWFARTLQNWLRLFDVRPRVEAPDYLADLARQRGGVATLQPVLGRYAFRSSYIAPTTLS